MKVAEQKELLKDLIASPGWALLQEKIDKMIEERRMVLEEVNPTRKEVQFDSYDITRMDIDNLRTLKELPKMLTKNVNAVGVDYSQWV